MILISLLYVIINVADNVPALSSAEPAKESTAAAPQHTQHQHYDQHSDQGSPEPGDLALQFSVIPLHATSAITLPHNSCKVSPIPGTHRAEVQLIVLALQVSVKPGAVIVIPTEMPILLPPPVPVIEAPPTVGPVSKPGCGFPNLVRSISHSSYNCCLLQLAFHRGFFSS